MTKISDFAHDPVNECNGDITSSRNVKCQCTQMKDLWIITAEILVKQGDLPSGNTKAFVNVVTWTDSSNNAERKVSRCLKSYGWHLLGIEAAHPLDDSRTYDEELLEIVDQARANPRACIVGRAFSYKPD